MAKFNLRQARLAAFLQYISAYNLDDQQTALKVEHSYKVAALCEEIAAKSGMAPADVDLAWLCGLIHDIGRFEQIRRYGTFNDSKSMSHALLGAAVLRGEYEGLADGRLERFLMEPADEQLVLKAVELHSNLVLPDGLSSRERTFCELLRDADKVDIIRVFGNSSCQTVLRLTEREFLNGSISDEAMEGFAEHRCLGPADRRANLDGLVGVICLQFELANESASSALRRLGYLELLVRRPFNIRSNFTNPDTRVKWQTVAYELGYY